MSYLKTYNEKMIPNGVINSDSLGNYIKPESGIPKSDLSEEVQGTLESVPQKQETLVSGENIRTINNESILGDGNIAITAQTYVIDNTPEADSNNLVKSGGVAREIVWDVTARNSNATFASLSALLSDANLATLIPTTIRRGGMQIRFVQSSDNKYVQYRLLTTSFSTTESDWQGVDETPTSGSQNLVTSGGVAAQIGSRQNTKTYGSESYCGFYYSSSQGKCVASASTANGILIPVVTGVKYSYTPALSGNLGVTLWSSLPAVGSGEGLTRSVIGSTGSFIPSSGDKYALIYMNLASYTSVTITESANNIYGDIENLDNVVDIALGDVVTNVYDSDDYCGYYYSPSSNKVLEAVSTVNGVIIPLKKGVKYTFDALNAPVTIWSDIPYLNSNTNFVRNLGNNATEFVAEEGEYYALFNIVFTQTTEKTIISGSVAAIKINEIYNCLTEENNNW